MLGVSNLFFFDSRSKCQIPNIKDWFVPKRYLGYTIDFPSGETSKFRYIARSINPREAYEIYREGPGGNWLTDLLSQYKLKFSFLKNNEEVNSFEI